MVGNLETGAGTAKLGGMFEARMRPDLRPGVGPGPEWGRPWRSILGNLAGSAGSRISRRINSISADETSNRNFRNLL